MTDLEPPDDPNEGLPDMIRASADALLERWRDLPDEFRQFGLYAAGEPQIVMVPTPFGPQAALMAHFAIGKVAFSKRIQHPEDAAFDNQFDVMAIQAEDDAFLDERERIRKALAEGRDPYFDDLEEDDTDD